jgi:prophage regulatory protein
MHPNHNLQPTAPVLGNQTKSSANLASGAPAQPDKLIRLPAVCELTGLGKSSIYGIPSFPKRIVLSPRAVGWRFSQVMAWIESRPTAGEKPV